MFHKDLYFPIKSLQYFFCDPYFYVTVQKFRVLYYVILLRATILCMALKGLLSVYSQ